MVLPARDDHMSARKRYTRKNMVIVCTMLRAMKGIVRIRGCATSARWGVPDRDGTLPAGASGARSRAIARSGQATGADVCIQYLPYPLSLHHGMPRVGVPGTVKVSSERVESRGVEKVVARVSVVLGMRWLDHASALSIR